MGVPRRYYAFDQFQFIPQASVNNINLFVSVAAILVGVAQLLFLINFLWSVFKGPKADRNPWKANTLEWQAPSPPPHGNWGAELPVVYRWPYDYSVPGAPEDFIPQTVPPIDVKQVKGDGDGGQKT
jgi:cytochrome c oxidase subunit 1